jgi:hypothetical protein
MVDNTALNIVPTKYDEEGLPYWESFLSPTANTTRAQCLVPPDKVIPIVFVPGIMGSNLKTVDAKKAGNLEIAWRPDVAGFWDIIRGAKDRQKLLDPSNTVVDDAIEVNKKVLVRAPSGMPLEAVKRRGWGTVYFKSYGDLLLHLEAILNLITFYEPQLKKVFTSALWQPLTQEGIALPQGPTLKL